MRPLLRSLLTLAMASLPAASFAQEPLDLLAPANRWTTTGGSPSRSGATRTRAVRGPVEIAWTHDAGGGIEGEPLVWDDVVLVSVARSDDLRVLRALDLLTGEPLVTDRIVRSKKPLVPSLWRNVVVYRGDENQMVAARIGKSRMSEIWSTRTAESVGPPLLVGERVYATTWRELACYALGRRAPLWSAPGQFGGAVSLSKHQAFAVAGNSASVGLGQFELATGRALAQRYVVPNLYPTRTAQIALLSFGAVVDFDAPIARVGSLGLRILGFPFAEGTSDAFKPLPSTLGMRSLPASTGPGWIAKIVDNENQGLLALEDDPKSDSLRALAAPDHHPEFARDDLPITVAGSVAYAGARAFEFDSGRILWQLPLKASERAVVARETVLLVDGGRRLVAVRSKLARHDASVLAAGNETLDGTIVLRDGSIERGEFAIDAAAQTVSRGSDKQRTSWRLADVVLGEDAARHVRCGSDPVRGIHYVTEDELAEAYVELAKKARSTNDVELIEDLVGHAASHGAEDKDLDAARQTVESLRKRPAPARIKTSDAAFLRAQAEELTKLAARAFVERAQLLPDALRPALDTKLLRAALECEPGNTSAREAVRALLPQTLRPAGDFDVLDALSFVEATRKTPVTFVPAPPEDERELDYAQRQVRTRLKNWRSDLCAVRSANLLILSPVQQHGALARCLALSELVCTALQQLCSNGEAVRNERFPLVIELCASREEYLARSEKVTGEERADLEWSAGHYDERANVSRFYFPADDTSLDAVFETAAHELTHHWLRARCPTWPYRAIELSDIEQPGYWIVEGFACFVGGFAFDVEHGTWTLGGANSLWLDLVANATAKQTLPWSRQLAMSHVQFDTGKLSNEFEIKSSVKLGRVRQVTSRAMFYAQAAATVRYLYEADDGAQRRKLFDFLRAYYTGDSDKLDLAHELGVLADPLGQRIVEHARRALEQP